ncbi:YybH family protein [Nitrospira sp. Kam-Ns4a]
MTLLHVERTVRGAGCARWVLALLLAAWPWTNVYASAAEPLGPEEVLRALVRANAAKDLAAMARFMAQDPDAIGYSIAGRKYVGWTEFAAQMDEEFRSVDRLEIPIVMLNVWKRGDIAWFAMELDYIRYVGTGAQQTRTLLPLRETGVLERRNGTWMVVTWHESFRTGGGALSVAEKAPDPATSAVGPPPAALTKPDLSGEWEIQEEDKSYTATLDRDGNGTYSWQGGRIRTTAIVDGKIQGTWHQSGNDREGGFEVLLSADGNEARGVWWYTRVGDKNKIPPRQWGGTYVWKRTKPAPTPTAKP